MTNKGIEIKYGDVAPEAKENFRPSTSSSEFATLHQLQQYNLNFPNYINPCELNQMVLNGNGQPFPDTPKDMNVGMISKQISDDKGVFDNPIIVGFIANEQYSSKGITLTFDTHNNTFPKDISVQWYRNTELLSSMNFSPNNATYFCQNQVDNYDAVYITFYNLNMPRNRLKFRAIDYGYGATFGGDELRNVKLIQEIDPISTQIAINTADFVIDSKSNIEYSFQTKQPLSIYFNGKLQATTFVKKPKRNSRFLWQIQSEDYIGVLDGTQFEGGIYVNKNAIELLTEIFNKAKVPFKVDDAFQGETITGYIPYTTCRDALMQVVFALQAAVDTSNSDVVNVFALDDTIKQTVPLNRIMQGQNFEDEEIVSGVELAAHVYTASNESVVVYDAIESGIGANIYVKFAEPLHSLTINNGEILLASTNYAVINALEGCVLTGKKYEHNILIKRRNNPVVTSTDLEKTVAIESATLVNPRNVDRVLEKCYNYIVNSGIVNAKIVEGKHVQYGEPIKYGQKKYGAFKYGERYPSVITYDEPVAVGDVIQTATEYLGDIRGRVIKQTFSLNGGVIVKDSVIRQGGTYGI